MRRTRRTPVAMPLRAVLVALLVAGFGLWQAWQCGDGMMASALATTMSAQSTAGHLVHDSVVAEDTRHRPGMPVGLAGMCITALAGLVVAFLLMSAPQRLLVLIRRLLAAIVRPVELPRRAPTLAELCVLRA